jgi:uncharacterized protein DUF6503
VKIGLGLLSALCLAAPAQSPPQVDPRPASDLLTRSIAYHDPEGKWQQGAFRITDISSRPDGTIGRRTILRIDNARGRFDMETRLDGRVVTATINGDSVETVRLDGRSQFSQEEVQRYQLTPAEVLTKRNFFLYLLGLPMKLRDPGTRLDPVAKETNFQGVAVYELRVTYEEGVGKDTWYFYLDSTTCALVGHRFYHNETAGDGEYAVLSEEITGQGLRLPRVRKWHRNQDGEWFITHTIERIEGL